VTTFAGEERGATLSEFSLGPAPAEHMIIVDLMERGKPEEARVYLHSDLRMDPSGMVSRINLAVVFQD